MSHNYLNKTILTNWRYPKVKGSLEGKGSMKKRTSRLLFYSVLNFHKPLMHIENLCMFFKAKCEPTTYDVPFFLFPLLIYFAYLLNECTIIVVVILTCVTWNVKSQWLSSLEAHLFITWPAASVLMRLF